MDTKWDKDVKFLHIRHYDDVGEVLAEGGLTAAYTRLDENTLLYAVAICHETDKYNKNLGRVKSQGRLRSPNYADTWEGEVDDLRIHLFGELQIANRLVD